MVKKGIKLLAALSLAVGLFSFVSLRADAAITVPTFTGAAYNIATGTLTIEGDNLQVKEGASYDIDLSKVIITDSVENKYTLKTKGKLVADKSSAIITLSSKEQIALAAFLDKNGTKAANGGSYQVNLYAGWDGITSTTDLTANALTVSNVPSLTSAEYDYTAGTLTLTGVALQSVTGAAIDISPKYLTVTNGNDRYYTLSASAGVKTTSATSAVITLSDKDKLGLQSVIDKVGKASAADNAYNILASAGWNGKITAASLGAHEFNVTNFNGPTVTFAADVTVTFKGSISIPANTFTKLGTVYAIPSGTSLDGVTQADLDALVTGKTAIKASITNTAAAISLSTSTLVLTTDSVDYVLIAVNKAGVLSAVSEGTITIKNVDAPALTVTVAKDTTQGSKVTATVAEGNKLAYEIVAAAVKAGTTVPKLSATVTVSGGSITATTSGSTIDTSLSIGKYINVYELSAANKVVKFKQIALTTSNVKLVVAVAASATATAGTKTITYTLTTGTFDATNGIIATNWTISGTNGSALGGISKITLTDAKTASIEVNNAVVAGKVYTVIPKAAAMTTGFAVPATSTRVTISVPAPVIATTSTIANGVTGAAIVVTGTAFKSSIALTDLTIGVGTTGLTAASVHYDSATQITITFTGTTAAGDVTIQAKTSAYSPVASEASNTLTVTVPAS